MEDPAEEQKSEQEAPAEVGRLQKLRAGLAGTGKFFGRLIPRLGLFALILILPALLVGYPGYLAVTNLMDYTTAGQLNAKLTDIEVNTVEQSGDQEGFFKAKRHIEAVFHFETEDKKKFDSKVIHSWPSPGLKRKLGEQYEVGETYTLYQTKLNDVLTEEAVAIKMFSWMTSLAGLLLLASSLMLMLWKRLLNKVPDVLPEISSALVQSLIYGQLIAIVIALAMTVIISQRPMVVPPVLFFSAFFGIALLMVLSLRLLAFGVTAKGAEKADQDEDEHGAAGGVKPERTGIR